MKRSITAVLLSVAMLSGAVVFAQTTGNASSTPSPITVIGSTTIGTLGNTLSALNKDAEQQIQALRQEMEAKIKAIRQDYQARIDAIRQATKNKVSQIRQQFKATQGQIKAQREQMRQKEKRLSNQRKKGYQSGTNVNSTSTPPTTNQ